MDAGVIFIDSGPPVSGILSRTHSEGTNGLRKICRMSEEMKKRRIEPRCAALLFLGLSMLSFNSAEGVLWREPLPWLLLGTSAGLWRAHDWARVLAMVVLVALLGAMAWPGGADVDPVRVLVVEPWVAAELEHRTGLYPTAGSTLVAALLLSWLNSLSVRRAFALSDLDAVEAGLPSLSDQQVKDDH
jgi:hypothetical protein